MVLSLQAISAHENKKFFAGQIAMFLQDFDKAEVSESYLLLPTINTVCPRQRDLLIFLISKKAFPKLENCMIAYGIGDL